MSTFKQALADWAAAIERGDVLPPGEFEQRCVLLARRGLARRITIDLYATNDAALLRRLEGLSDDQLRQLNEAAGMNESPAQPEG